MPFVDIAFLRRSQINDNQLTYYRHKTGQRIVIPLEPCMNEIISRYQSDSEYVFPLLRSLEPQKAYNEYLQMLNRYNRSLKTLARKAGVTRRLTSYTPRHTWASVAYDQNVDLSVISKALGHTNTQTTLTYIKEISDNRLAEANHLIVGRI
jgi:integrase